MGHYKSNVRDLEFNLFEVFTVQDHLGTGPFEQADEETARGILTELNNLAVGPLADSFAESDRNPPVFDPKTHSVTLPEAFRQSYRALWDGEWYRLSLPEDLGGFGVPPSVQWAASELVLGANPSAYMTAGDVLVGWLLLRQAEVALTKLAGEPSAKDKAFYEGKVAVASFFAKTVLPELSARRKSTESTDNSLMDLDEAAF